MIITRGFGGLLISRGFGVFSVLQKIVRFTKTKITRGITLKSDVH